MFMSALGAKSAAPLVLKGLVRLISRILQALRGSLPMRIDGCQPNHQDETHHDPQPGHPGPLVDFLFLTLAKAQDGELVSRIAAR